MNTLMRMIIILTLLGSLIPQGRVYAEEDLKESAPAAELTADVHLTHVDARVHKLSRYLEYVQSPMASSAKTFVKEADEHGLDWKLVAAIAGNESYFGTYIPENSYNGWGWAVWTGMSYGASFGNWDEGIATVSEGLAKDYVAEGLTSVDAIGPKYAADPNWSWKVNHFMEEIDEFSEENDHVDLLSLAQ